jgi:hypothetical protein
LSGIPGVGRNYRQDGRLLAVDRARRHTRQTSGEFAALFDVGAQGAAQAGGGERWPQRHALLRLDEADLRVEAMADQLSAHP